MSTQLLDQIDDADFTAMPAEDGSKAEDIPDPDETVHLSTPDQEEEKRYKNGVSVNMWHSHSTLLKHQMARFNP